MFWIVTANDEAIAIDSIDSSVTWVAFHQTTVDGGQIIFPWFHDSDGDEWDTWSLDLDMYPSDMEYYGSNSMNIAGRNAAGTKIYYVRVGY